MTQAMGPGRSDVRRTRATELLGCFGIVTVLFWLYSFFTKVPIIHGDEAGYLLNAAAFAGYRTDAFSSYYPAYSLPISLAYLGGTAPDTAYDIIQAINAVFWGAAATLAYALAARLRPQSTLRERALVVAVTVLYPAFPVFASLALSENLFAPTVLLLAFVLYRQANAPTWPGAVLVGALVALLTLGHPKGVFVGAAAALAMLAHVRAQWIPALSRVAVMGLTAIVLYLSSRHVLDAYLREMLNAKDLAAFDHYPGREEILGNAAKLLTGPGLARFFGVMSGQALYLLIASLGLVFVGCAWCVRTMLVRTAPPGERALAVFSLFSLLGVYAFSVFFMKEGVRADHVMYGRYSESVIAPLLLLGALCLPAKRDLAWAAIIAAALGALVLVLQGNPIGGAIVAMNVTAVDPLRQVFPGVLNVVGLAMAGALAILVVRTARNPAGAMAVVVVLFAVNAIAFGTMYLRPGSTFRGQQHTLANIIERDFPDATCVNYDMGNMAAWERNNYQFYLLPKRLDSVSGKDLFQCGALLISSAADLGPAAPDAVVIGQEFGSEQRLWIKRAELQAWMDRQPPMVIPEGGQSVGARAAESVGGLQSGWYQREDWGVWSKPSAMLVLQASSHPGRALQLEFSVLANAAIPRTLRITCKGKPLATAEYRDQEPGTLRIEAANFARSGCADGDRIVLDLAITPAVSPADLGQSVDSRQLGIGLKKVDWVDARR